PELSDADMIVALAKLLRPDRPRSAPRIALRRCRAARCRRAAARRLACGSQPPDGPRRMKLHVLVVDDEPPARRRLTAMLAPTGRTETIREAANADEAAVILASHRFDVGFLDVRMPGRSGLELARVLGARRVVVFTTAYSEHAVDAFDTAAADYLLKPVAANK